MLEIVLECKNIADNLFSLNQRDKAAVVYSAALQTIEPLSRIPIVDDNYRRLV